MLLALRWRLPNQHLEIPKQFDSIGTRQSSIGVQQVGAHHHCSPAPACPSPPMGCAQISLSLMDPMTNLFGNTEDLHGLLCHTS